MNIKTRKASDAESVRTKQRVCLWIYELVHVPNEFSYRYGTLKRPIMRTVAVYLGELGEKFFAEDELESIWKLFSARPKILGSAWLYIEYGE